MTSDFEPSFKAFESLVVSVNVDWKTWSDMCAPGVIETFHRVGIEFFLTIKEALLSQVLVGLSALLDKNAVCGRENLSAQWIIIQPEVSAIRADLEQILKPLLDKWKDGPAKYRHKVIAHRDFEVFTKQTSFPPVVFQDIDAIALGLWEFTRLIQSKVFGHEMPSTVPVGTGFATVLAHLQLGLKAGELGNVLNR